MLPPPRAKEEEESSSKMCRPAEITGFGYVPFEKARKFKTEKGTDIWPNKRGATSLFLLNFGFGHVGKELLLDKSLSFVKFQFD